MSLLLDALQRASRDKEKAALGKAADGEIRLRPSKPGDPAFPHLQPEPDPAPPSQEPALELLNAAAPASPQQDHEAAPVPEPAPDWEMVDAVQETPTPAQPSTPAPASPVVPQSDTPVARTPSQVQVAQDIRRAYGQDAVRPAKPRRHLLLLGGVATVLLLGLGVLFWLGRADSGLGVSPPVPTPAPADAPNPATAAAEPAVAMPPASAALVVSPPVPPVIAGAPAPLPARSVTEPSARPVTAPAAAVSAPADATASAPAATAPAKSGLPAPLAGHTLGLRSIEPVAVVESRTRGPSALEAGYSALLEGRWDEAARFYGQALGNNPQERDALLGLGYVASQKGQRDEAQGYYRRVLRQDPGNAIANAALLTLDAETNATQTSGQARELAARQPDSALALSTAGHALVREGSLADAALYFARAQMLEPANALHAYNHAVALDRLGQSAQAAVQYQRVLTLAEKAPSRAASAFSLDAVRQRLEQLRQALNPRTEATP